MSAFVAAHAVRWISSTCCGVLQTEAVEDCLKRIFGLSGRGEDVSTSALAAQLGVSAPTVSAMLKRLETHGLISRTDQHRVSLTPHGEDHARRVVRRHRLVETFLGQVLEIPWDEVHAEAERLEHVISDRLEERIAAYLGHPTRDPHGDPIPPAVGTHVEAWSTPLTTAPPGSRFRVERVSDRDSAALRYLADLGIRPGVTIEVGTWEPFGGSLPVTVGDEQRFLGSALADVVHGAVV